MQNKPNLLDAQMNLSSIITMNYENISNWTLGQNKPNSNPIKPNFLKAQMNVNSFITKDYRKKDDFVVRINKPNSNPIQTQSKPILERMNVNFCTAGYYESKPTFAVRKGRRTVTVTANVEPISQISQIQATLESEVLPQLARSFPGLSYAWEGRQQDMMESTASLFMGLILALFAIYVLLAIPFGSYYQPLIVMIAIPFGIVGAVMGHLIMGYSLSLMSMMGIVALSGVVINDSLILIDYANRLARQGTSPFEAIHQGGMRRFRPILLTTLTTFGGLSPMIFETSRQARFMIPMAISLGFGVLFATAVTLLIVPCLYLMAEDVRKFTRFFYPASQELATASSPEIG